MYRTIELSGPLPVEHEVVLERWRWFKARVEWIRGFQSLPDSFTPGDGEIRTYERVLEDDLQFDFVAAEYNYGGRTQTLRFLHEWWFVEVVISCSDIGDYFRFELNAPEVKEKVRFISTFHGSRLEMDDESAYFAAWAKAGK